MVTIETEVTQCYHKSRNVTVHHCNDVDIRIWDWSMFNLQWCSDIVKIIGKRGNKISHIKPSRYIYCWINVLYNWKAKYRRGCWCLISRFNLVIYLSLGQDSTWISTAVQIKMEWGKSWWIVSFHNSINKGTVCAEISRQICTVQKPPAKHVLWRNLPPNIHCDEISRLICIVTKSPAKHVVTKSPARHVLWQNLPPNMYSVTTSNIFNIKWK